MPVRANVVLTAAVGLIAAVAAAAAVVAVQREPVTLDPSSPEGVVQAYLAAVSADDLPAAAELLAEDSRCDLQDLAAAYPPESIRVVLVSSEESDDGAMVVVEITDVYGEELFDSSGYTHTERLFLVEEESGWRITGSPWPMYSCSEV